MAFDLHIKNIGKLDDAHIRIGQFTVLAGPNNTGKSFVSKLLYSLFDAMNANLAKVAVQNLTRSVKNDLRRILILGRSDNLDYEVLKSCDKEVEKFENEYNNFSIGDENIPDPTDFLKTTQTTLLDVHELTESVSDPDRLRHLARLEESLIQLRDEITKVNAEQLIVAGIVYKVKENLIQNFQISELSELAGKENSPSKVNTEGIGNFKFSNDEIKFQISLPELVQLQQYSNVIYLESPIYWKLKNALEILRLDSTYWHSRRERLNGIPGYFYDLASKLKHQYTGDVAFPELYDRLTGKEVLNGKISISESGDLLFLENGRSFPLQVTATGVANLGVLALLVERKILDKGSFLFIDEPEAHLHPAWQVIMAESLFELAKGGVNVVIATHSPDILKWLEVYVKNNQDDEKMVALNKFTADGVVSNDGDFNDKIAAIKQELTKPFADLYVKGLL